MTSHRFPTVLGVIVLSCGTLPSVGFADEQQQPQENRERLLRTWQGVEERCIENTAKLRDVLKKRYENVDFGEWPQHEGASYKHPCASLFESDVLQTRSLRYPVVGVIGIDLAYTYGPGPPSVSSSEDEDYRVEHKMKFTFDGRCWRFQEGQRIPQANAPRPMKQLYRSLTEIPSLESLFLECLLGPSAFKSDAD